jgi:hypothetical protein
MARGSDKGEQRLSRRVAELLAERLATWLADPIAAAATRDATAAALSEKARANIDAVLAHDAPSYREAFLIQAAFGLCQPGLDLCMRQEGGRGVAASFARLLRRGHIRATADAFQNIGKNVINLARGNVPEFDQLLGWATEASPAELAAGFDYAMTILALTARPVLPMPEVASAKLTFFKMTRLLEALLDQPSGRGAGPRTPPHCLQTKRLPAPSGMVVAAAVPEPKMAWRAIADRARVRRPFPEAQADKGPPARAGGRLLSSVSRRSATQRRCQGTTGSADVPLSGQPSSLAAANASLVASMVSIVTASCTIWITCSTV